ncbi:hypothetical protein CEQ30_04395 [Nocardia brasiliensis]|nr:hypothetical protein CEQ30_04395 [Nocardia brasiliensis]
MYSRSRFRPDPIRRSPIRDGNPYIPVGTARLRTAVPAQRPPDRPGRRPPPDGTDPRPDRWPQPPHRCATPPTPITRTADVLEPARTG